MIEVERMAKLIITSGEDVGRELSLGDTQIIGRLPSNAIPIKDVGSSRQNTRLFRAGGRFTVIDLNSKNGTFVNGLQVQRADLKGVQQLGNRAKVFVNPFRDGSKLIHPGVGGFDPGLPLHFRRPFRFGVGFDRLRLRFKGG